MAEIPRAEIIGVKISAIDMDVALETIDSWVAERAAHYICVTPVHSIMDCQKDPDLMRIFNASGLTTPDGMPLVWLLKAFGHRQIDRVYGPDLMLALSQHGVTRGYRHYFYGGAPGIAERLSARLQERFPGLQVVGTYCPPFRPLTQDEDWQVIETIRAAQPDIVWVGISSPKQEYWMRDHVERLGVPALIGVGAAFDFHSGAKRQAPRWIQRSGFEWLFRLANEPLRLWPRYRQYPRFVWLVLRQLLHRTG
jgi:N-acetylglucosaminyldiphosphoundecaprenol N-acetyl-beta-D-mannosaminyltransferase